MAQAQNLGLIVVKFSSLVLVLCLPNSTDTVCIQLQQYPSRLSRTYCSNG